MSERRIAVIPVYREKTTGDYCVVLVTTRGSGEWILPTGKHEKRRGDRRVAMVEAFEEAGLSGRLIGRPKRLKAKRNDGRRQELKIFLFRVKKVLKEWPEDKQRRRAFVHIHELRNYLQDKSLREHVERQFKRYV